MELETFDGFSNGTQMSKTKKKQRIQKQIKNKCFEVRNKNWR